MRNLTKKQKIVCFTVLAVVLGALCLLKHNEISAAALLIRVLLLFFGYLAALWDLTEKRVPNRLLGYMLAARVLVAVPQLFSQTEAALAILLDGILGALLGGGIFFLAYVVSRKGLGGGDVKLMTISGMYLGVAGVLPTILYGSILAALAGGVLILGKRIKAQDSIPLVPFLYAGMLLAVFVR